MILALILSSCTPPVINPKERCHVTLEFDYGTNEQVREFFANLYLYDNHPELRDEFIADFAAVFGKTRCIKYNLMTPKAEGEGYDKPLSHADDVIGFSKEDWAEDIHPWAVESKEFYEKKCK